MKKLLLSLYCGALALGLLLNHAGAIPAFKKEFEEKYVKKDSSDPADKAFAETVKDAKCLLCHGKNDKGKEDKKVRNAYGKALSKLLDKKKDVKNKEKIRKALDTVAGEKVDEKKADSPTFGELIKAGKLPGGDGK
jgi:cytochrome c553